MNTQIKEIKAHNIILTHRQVHIENVYGLSYTKIIKSTKSLRLPMEIRQQYRKIEANIEKVNLFCGKKINKIKPWAEDPSKNTAWSLQKMVTHENSLGMQTFEPVIYN